MNTVCVLIQIWKVALLLQLLMEVNLVSLRIVTQTVDQLIIQYAHFCMILNDGLTQKEGTNFAQSKTKLKFFNT